MLRLTCLLLLAAIVASPARAQSPSASKIPQLLAALKAAPDEAAAAALEGALEQAWAQAGSPAVTLLMARGIREADAADNVDALEDFNDALDLDPKLAEAWNRIALVHIHMGNLKAAIADLGHALQIEPRHFPALQELSRIAQSRGDWKSAYEAWRRAMTIDPKTPGGAARLRDLRRHAFGEET
jgi:tetratricopeptide (TPR) repeat protein